MKIETMESEFKREINEKSWISWCKTIAAFANTKGGKIMFGYDDNGAFLGIENHELDKKIRHIEQIIRSHVEPLPIYSIGDYDSVNDKTAFSITVRKRSESITWLFYNDVPMMYVRREKMSVLATVEEIQNALLKAQTYDYDNTGVGIIANLQQFSKLNEYYQRVNEGQSLINNDLISLNLTTAKSYLTITGILFADQSNYRNANVICNTWPETTKGTNRVNDSKTCQASALALFEFMLNYIKNVSHYRFGGIKRGIFFVEDGSFSTIALREAIINAIAHRDYQIVGSEIVVDCYPDRIEIISPGSMLQYEGGVNHVALEVLPSLRRNPNICRVFVKCRLMEEKGSGFAKIIEDYKNMSAVFQPICAYNQKMFMLCLKNKKYQYSSSVLIDNRKTTSLDYLMQKDMFKTRNQIYEERPKMRLIETYICQNPHTSYEQIRQNFHLSRDGVKYYIRQLKEACLIRRKGNHISGYYEIVDDIDRPNDFLNLDTAVQSRVLKWCKNFFSPTKSFEERHTSYNLKQILQNDDQTYLTNGQFKGAMLLAGFKVKKIEDLNWKFNISETSEALKLKSPS